MGPLGEGFVDGFREAEVDLGAEELVDGEEAIGGEELAGADKAEGVVEVGGHEVLAAFAAGEAEVGDAGAEAAGLIGEHAAVFVVGVGDDHEEAGAGGELFEGEGEAGGALVGGEVGAEGGADLFAGEVGWVVDGWVAVVSGLGRRAGRCGRAGRERRVRQECREAERQECGVRPQPGALMCHGP